MFYPDQTAFLLALIKKPTPGFSTNPGMPLTDLTHRKRMRTGIKICVYLYRYVVKNLT